MEFGFTPREANDLVTALLAHPGVVERVILEPRRPTPVDRELAWTVSCVVRGGGVFAEIAELQREANVEAVLQGDRTVLLRRLTPDDNSG